MMCVYYFGKYNPTGQMDSFDASDFDATLGPVVPSRMQAMIDQYIHDFGPEIMQFYNLTPEQYQALSRSDKAQYMHQYCQHLLQLDDSDPDRFSASSSDDE